MHQTKGELSLKFHKAQQAMFVWEGKKQKEDKDKDLFFSLLLYVSFYMSWNFVNEIIIWWSCLLKVISLNFILLSSTKMGEIIISNFNRSFCLVLIYT